MCLVLLAFDLVIVRGSARGSEFSRSSGLDMFGCTVVSQSTLQTGRFCVDLVFDKQVARGINFERSLASVVK